MEPVEDATGELLVNSDSETYPIDSAINEGEDETPREDREILGPPDTKCKKNVCF